MLELIAGVFRSLFGLDHWLSGGHLLDALRHKRLERQQVSQREARASNLVNQPPLGRLGSRGTP